MFATHFVLLVSAVYWRKYNIFFKDLLNLLHKNASVHFTRSVLLYQAGRHDHFTSRIYLLYFIKSCLHTKPISHPADRKNSWVVNYYFCALSTRDGAFSHLPAFALWEQNWNLGNLEAGGTILSKTEWG